MSKRAFRLRCTDISLCCNCLVVCVVFFGTSLQVHADTSSYFPERKQVLLQRLDSIDMEKQLRKRRGESIDNLEKYADIIKDSVLFLKQQMAQNTVADTIAKSPEVAVHAPQNVFLEKLRSLLPKTPIDWGVAIIACVALVSGIVLIVGLFGMFSRRHPKKKKISSKTLHDIFPASHATAAYGNIPPVKSNQERKNGDNAGSDVEELKSINSISTDTTDENVLATVDEGEPAFPVDAVLKSDSGDMEAVKRRVAEAAHAGLDKSDIARKLHLSVDQVALILRISRQQSKHL